MKNKQYKNTAFGVMTYNKQELIDLVACIDYVDLTSSTGLLPNHPVNAVRIPDRDGKHPVFRCMDQKSVLSVSAHLSDPFHAESVFPACRLRRRRTKQQHKKAENCAPCFCLPVHLSPPFCVFLS